MIARKQRLVAALVQAAPLLGIPLYVWAMYATQNLLVFFFPGMFLLFAGLVAALLGRLFSPPGFVRDQSAASLRFHGIIAAVAVVLIPVLFVAMDRGVMIAAHYMVVLFGVLLALAEIVRALVCGTAALKAIAPAAPMQQP